MEKVVSGEGEGLGLRLKVGGGGCEVFPASHLTGQQLVFQAAP